MTNPDTSTFAEKQFNLSPGLFPFESQFINIGEARIHYIREGNGPTLFFLHGNPTWSFLYRNIIMALRDEYECIAIDLPGFGLSQTPSQYAFTPAEHTQIVRQFLTQLNISNGCLIAHDWGGPIGLSAMFETENCLTRFCLGNTWGWPVNGIFHFEWFSRLMGGAIGRWTNQRHAIFVNRIIPTSMKRRKLDDAIMKAYRAPFEPPRSRRPLHIFPREILKSKQFLAQLEKNLSGYKGHAAFIWPENDIAFRANEIQKWQNLIPQAKVLKLTNCGHYLWEDATDEVISYLRSHLGTIFAADRA
jgi:haloalkane dehalogenase